jgi:ABC-type siderophore export system fused ATPase/permease subunit
MRKTIQNIFAEYGAIAVVVYFAIFFLVLLGFWAAFRFGWKPSSAAATVGVWTAAYIATKLTQPVRIIATLVVTPLVAKLHERVTRRANRA